MEERIALLRDYDTGVFTVTELCARYGISRETFYERKRRRDGGDERWFEDRSHATVICPHRTPLEMVDAVIAMRKRRLRRPFGPKKIRAQLVRAQPEVEWPAISTIGDILKPREPRINLPTSRVSRASSAAPYDPVMIRTDSSAVRSLQYTLFSEHGRSRNV